MKNSKLYISILLVAVVGMVGISCLDQNDISYSGPPRVELFPLNNSTNQSGSFPIKAQLIGRQRDTDLTLSLSVVDSSTSVPASTYQLTSNSITIPAQSSSASFNVNIDNSNLTQAGQVVILLTGTDQVEAAENLRRSTIIIQPPAASQ